MAYNFSQLSRRNKKRCYDEKSDDSFHSVIGFKEKIDKFGCVIKYDILYIYKKRFFILCADMKLKSMTVVVQYDSEESGESRAFNEFDSIPGSLFWNPSYFSVNVNDPWTGSRVTLFIETLSNAILSTLRKFESEKQSYQSFGDSSFKRRKLSLCNNSTIPFRKRQSAKMIKQAEDNDHGIASSLRSDPMEVEYSSNEHRKEGESDCGKRGTSALEEAPYEWLHSKRFRPDDS